MNQKKTSGKLDSGKKVTSKQIAAIIGIVLLLALYLITLIVAFVDQSASKSLFQVCLFGTVAIPVLIWIYIWMYGKLTQKRTIADTDLTGSAAADIDMRSTDMPGAGVTGTATDNADTGTEPSGSAPKEEG